MKMNKKEKEKNTYLYTNEQIDEMYIDSKNYEEMIRFLVIKEYRLYEEIERLYRNRYDSNETLSYFLVRSKEIKIQLELLEYILKRYDYKDVSTTYLELKGVNDLMKYVR